MVISTGGGEFVFTLDNGANPMAGVKVYVFNPSGSYLGISGTTDENGRVGFPLSDGIFRFRVDYLGQQFWSDIYATPGVLSGGLTIAHRDITVAVRGDFPVEPLPDVKIYLFKPSGSYLGMSGKTDTNGNAVFSLPDADYKIRADFLGNQFWSDVFRFDNVAVNVSRGIANIRATRAGIGVPNARVYLFSATGSYLGQYKTTDPDGHAAFLLPNRTYRFRIDEGGNQYWTPITDILPGDTVACEVMVD